MLHEERVFSDQMFRAARSPSAAPGKHTVVSNEEL